MKTQTGINLLGKLEGLEAQNEYWKPRQNSDHQDANRRPPYNAQGDRTDRQTATDVTVCGYNNYNMRMASTVTGSEITVRRIDATEESGTTPAGGQQEATSLSRKQHGGSLSLNLAAQNFETQTEDTRPNFQQQRPPNHIPAMF